jgi:hypothetical protein
MKAPQSVYDAVRDAASAEDLDSTAQRTKVRKAIESDPIYNRAVLDAHAGALLAEYRRAHQPAPDILQAELFPALPAMLYTSPGVRVSPMDCTRYGLEMARNMLYARTGNQMQGAADAAKREREAIDALCDLVMPVMDADPKMTVAGALAILRNAGAAVSPG